MRFLVLFLFFILSTRPVLSSSDSLRDRRAFFSGGSKPIDHPIIQDAAQFAVGELKKLSDSGIYTTLELAQIRSAAAETGDFHYAVLLHVALASPYFQSGNATEEYEMMVLESKDLVGQRPKRERSIAINEFPKMDDDAIEEFWIRMVQERRRKRAALFASWRQEAESGIDPVVAAAAEMVMKVQGIPPRPMVKISTKSEPSPIEKPTPTSIKKKKIKMLTIDELHAMTTKQLRTLLSASSGVTDALREAIAEIIDNRLDRLEHHEQTIVTHQDEL